MLDCRLYIVALFLSIMVDRWWTLKSIFFCFGVNEADLSVFHFQRWVLNRPDPETVAEVVDDSDINEEIEEGSVTKLKIKNAIKDLKMVKRLVLTILQYR